ncbi:phosphoglycerate mutase family protein [Hyphomonas polymorpha PS728]|uniref:Phosphoglycerate mutase family protein n=1 Tax=Hyphomonas polymorpha PS728 TaxID=1280954 RepID=A0A062VK97_9PROT|nr:alpha-ribazole phosphatase family protein [Hyphomonas polymorpha]KCZ99029.1 phosphoglycerate mutase family protein [Hyphomonas polymorpha PS728]
MALILVRHTRPEGTDGLCYGRLDVPLAASFEEEARALAAGLPPFDHLITSPATRCRRLADWLGARRGLVPLVDHRFQEMDFGRWEGRLWSEISEGEINAWAEHFFEGRPHGGENVADLADRVGRALTCVRRWPGNILIITHAGVVRAALAAAGQAGAWQASIAYASATWLDGLEAREE